MVVDANIVLANIEKAIKSIVVMSKPNEDNEIDELAISAIGARLLYETEARFLYQIGITYKSAIEVQPELSTESTQSHLVAELARQTASIVIMDRENNANAIKEIIKFRILDERRPMSRIRDDFFNFGCVAHIIDKQPWGAILCAMICELPTQSMSQRKDEFERKTQQFVTVNAPRATRVRHLYREPILSVSEKWKWMVAGIILHFDEIK